MTSKGEHTEREREREAEAEAADYASIEKMRRKEGKVRCAIF